VSALRQAVPAAFEIVSGDDSLTVPFLSAGAVGLISVASNYLPREVSDLVRAWLDGRIADACAAHHRLYPLFKDFFIEPNPVPVKFALSLRGVMTPEVASRCAKWLRPMSSGCARRSRRLLARQNRATVRGLLRREEADGNGLVAADLDREDLQLVKRSGLEKFVRDRDA